MEPLKSLPQLKHDARDEYRSWLASHDNAPLQAKRDQQENIIERLLPKSPDVFYMVAKYPELRELDLNPDFFRPGEFTALEVCQYAVAEALLKAMEELDGD
jgi:hypothetical protein